MCVNAGLIIPTSAFDPGNTVAIANNFETFCGEYLNPLSAMKLSGAVTSKFILHKEDVQEVATFLNSFIYGPAHVCFIFSKGTRL
jgi:hypothetical protein